MHTSPTIPPQAQAALVERERRRRAADRLRAAPPPLTPLGALRAWEASTTGPSRKRPTESWKMWLARQPEWQTWLRALPLAEKAALRYNWPFHARPNQRLPPGDWTTWLLCCGRGFGKTRTAAEAVRELVESGLHRRVGIIARTAGDVRVMLTGESGLLRITPPATRPIWVPSRRELVWPNGALGTTFTAEKPDQLRGPEHDLIWGDEVAAWSYPDTWDQAMFTLRIGRKPRAIASTTPRPTQLIRRFLNDASGFVHVTRGATRENAANLAAAFFTSVIKRYEGTTLGRQELEGQLIDDRPGALWTREAIRYGCPALTQVEFVRVVVAIDPATSSGENACETGIVAAGLGTDGRYYVLADVSGVYHPEVWAKLALTLYHALRADAIVAEVNNGGDLVSSVLARARVDLDELLDAHEGTELGRLLNGLLEQVPGPAGGPMTRDDLERLGPIGAVGYRAVHASKGKATRAEPISLLYQRGLCVHARQLEALEAQMCNFVPGDLLESPDRVDAAVWALTDLSSASPPKDDEDFYIGSGRRQRGAAGRRRR